MEAAEQCVNSIEEQVATLEDNALSHIDGSTSPQKTNVPDEIPNTATAEDNTGSSSTPLNGLVDVSMANSPSSTVEIPVANKLGALGVLHVYDSDSDDVPEEINAFVPKNISNVIPNQYRDVEDSSSDSEESSSSATSDTSSSTSEDISSFSDSESVCESKKNKPIQRKPPKTNGELLLDDLPPIEDLHITVQEQECMEVGKISAIVDRMVVVQAHKNRPALDLDSVLFLDKGKRALGRIFDVIGPVCEPAYCIRFNSTAHIHEKGIEKGLAVYCAPKSDHTSYVFLGELLKMKGSDASWKANNEPPLEMLEYSDDEEERRARRRKRQASSDVAASSQTEIVEPSSYERHMNAKNLARSQIVRKVTMASTQGRGKVRADTVIQNMHSASEQYSLPPQPPPLPHARPSYPPPMNRPQWPGFMPMFPSGYPVPSPYQFGVGTGPFFPMLPPRQPQMLSHQQPQMRQGIPSPQQHMYSTPPPPTPPNQNPYYRHPQF